MHATICDYLADIAQNSIEAGASLVELQVIESCEFVTVAVKDNGKGMDDATLARIWDPFYSTPGKHARRRVGLGLPLLRQAVEATGGNMSLNSVAGEGTTVEFAFASGHLDTPPLGNLATTIAGLMGHDGDYDLVLTRRHREAEYRISRHELSEVLGDLRLAGNLALTMEYLRSQEEHLREASGGSESDPAHYATQEGEV